MVKMPTPHSCCCTPVATQNNSVACPFCGCPGHSVEALTLRALLRPELVLQLRDIAYHFCATPACPVVYFAPGDDNPFMSEGLKVRVGVKVADPPRPICYCFGHTVESLREEVATAGLSKAVGAIQAVVKAGTCRCEVMNPSGRCCLGDVFKALVEPSGSRLDVVPE